MRLALGLLTEGWDPWVQIIAQLLYLNYESQDRPIYMYINSPGISTPDGRAMGFDTEAFAIADVMQ
jgi:ATP-dependent Clp protease protease subunit